MEKRTEKRRWVNSHTRQMGKGFIRLLYVLQIVLQIYLLLLFE